MNTWQELMSNRPHKKKSRLKSVWVSSKTSMTFKTNCRKHAKDKMQTQNKMQTQIVPKYQIITIMKTNQSFRMILIKYLTIIITLNSIVTIIKMLCLVKVALNVIWLLIFNLKTWLNCKNYAETNSAMRLYVR